MKTHDGRKLWVMLTNGNGLRAALFLATSGISALMLFGAGCGLNFGPQKLYCDPDGGDNENFPACAQDAGTSIAPQSVKCEDNGSACVALGTLDFEKKAVLLWIGDEMDAPPCPERAPSEHYTGYGDLAVEVTCDKCTCSAPTCVLPHAIGLDKQAACGSGVSDNYAAPVGWDGSCFSPAQAPAGSFASFALPPATVTGCTPSSSPPIKTPSAKAPTSNVFFGGVGWKQYAKACNGNASGECESAGDSCVPNAEPRPPEFQYCVAYMRDVDEANLPQCPAAFPEQHVFYRKWEGKRECTPCACGEPQNGQCMAAFSAYQDPACSDMPAPFFENVASAGCIGTMPSWTLGAISAKWVFNAPGTCEPSGGEPVGEIKPVDPRLFCCEPLPEKPLEE